MEIFKFNLQKKRFKTNSLKVSNSKPYWHTVILFKAFLEKANLSTNYLSLKIDDSQ